jgi:hypothetical protein
LRSPDRPQAIRGVALDAARAAKRKALARLRDFAAVNGVGLARRGAGYVLKVNLSAPLAEDASLPTEIDGVPVTAEVVGPIQPLRRSR